MCRAEVVVAAKRGGGRLEGMAVGMMGSGGWSDYVEWMVEMSGSMENGCWLMRGHCVDWVGCMHIIYEERWCEIGCRDDSLNEE